MSISTTRLGWTLAALVLAAEWCPWGQAMAAPSEAEQAKAILRACGFKGGLVVHVGCGDGRLTAALRATPRTVVHGLDADVTEARRSIRAAGLYGPVSVERWSGGPLPYVDNLVRLLVVSGNGQRLSRKEMLRVLCPGGVAMVAGSKIVKPWPSEIDEWPQHFHGADNNAVARDSVVGPPRHYQWIAEPQWGRSHLALPSMNSMVSAGGRLFTIEDQASVEHPALPGKFALVCRDAFNGVMLWSRRFPDWQPINIYVKFTPAQLQRQLAAIGETVYCTPGLDAPITALDAATGAVLKKYPGTERTQEFAYDKGVLFVVMGDPFDTAGIGVTRGTIGPSAFPVRAYGPEIPKLADPKSTIVAIDAESGRTLWQKSGDDTRAYQGTSLAVRGPHAVYCTADSLICLDRNTGAERWRVPVGVSLGGGKAGARKGITGRPGMTVAVMLSDETVYLADAKALTAFALKDGTRMWSGKTKMNHFKSPDLFLAAGAVWTANKLAYDPRTGRDVRTLPQEMTGPMGHDRCYRNRITERWYINTATGGSDFLALDGSGEFPNPWVRSTCGIGGLPCNGLFYAGPPACSCSNAVQLNAFNALAAEPGLKSSGQPIAVAVNPRLEKGPAYGEPLDARAAAGGADWPTYRQDSSRSGCTRAAVPAALRPQWQTRLATRASAPVIADGKVFVADVDAHAVCALDAGDGRVLWTCTTGARVDSPPTWHRGRILFGSHDGWVYCLRATDGALAWRFKALPDRLICAYEQMESPWPVCGSILIRDNVAYFAAGRNSFLDGGIYLFGLDPQTGRVIHQRNLYGPYGRNGQPIISPVTAVGATGAGGIRGSKGDILLADGRFLYMRHEAFEPDLAPVDYSKLTEPHLITSHGFTEAIPHHRSFWTIDTTIRYDIPTGGRPVHGDILVRDGSRYYEVRGYRPSRTAHFDPREGGYTLFAGDLSKAARPQPAARAKRAAGARKSAGAKKPAGARAKKTPPRIPASQRWSANIPLTGKAMALAGDVLFVAGTPVAFPKDDLAKAYEGRMGGVLWAASAEDGRKLAEYKLDAPPTWDSLAAANGRLYLCTTDGRVRCFAPEPDPPGRGERGRTRADDGDRTWIPWEPVMHAGLRLCVDAIIAAGLLASGDVRPLAGDANGPTYEVVDLVGWQSQGLMSGPGLQGRGGGAYPVIDGEGGVYTQNRTVIRRWDPKTRRVEVVAGCGVPGCFDGPADLARFDIDTYSGGGMEISADGETLYLMDQQARGGAIRVVDLQKRRVSTLAEGRIGRGTKRAVICLAMDDRGMLYAGGRSGIFQVSTGGEVRDVGCEGITSSQLCIEVDRKRGVIYGMDRTNPANFFCWKITGGPRTLLAGEGLDPKPQYTSDGPVRRMWLKCPSGMRMDPQGFLVIGGGDSRTFRRIDLDRMEVRSLCGPTDKYDGTGLFTWDHGDGKRNRGGGFPTWVSYPGFDEQGNIYFGWSVWPKLVMLKRVDREAKR